jgi:hypothetical protein
LGLILLRLWLGEVERYAMIHLESDESQVGDDGFQLGVVQRVNGFEIMLKYQFKCPEPAQTTHSESGKRFHRRPYDRLKARRPVFSNGTCSMLGIGG